MTLFELARELFTYLVRFREKASSTAAPPLPEVRRDLLGIFARMDNQAKKDPLLKEPYHQVHYALVGLADEVVLTSGWEHSPAWRQALLEERFYNSQEAGSRFFELVNTLDHAPQDVIAIFYLCLALGFSGRYAPADPELAEVKEKLLSRLPSKPRIMEEPSNSRTQQDHRMRGWLWGAAAMAVLLAAVILGWDQWQTNQASRSSAPPAPASKAAQKAEPAMPETPVAAHAETAQQPIAPVKPDASAVAKTEPAAPPIPAPARADLQKAKTETPEPKVPDAAIQPKEEMRAEAPRQPSVPPPNKPEAPGPAPVAAEKPPAAEPPAPPQEKKAAPVPREEAVQRSYRVRVGVYVGPIQSGRFSDQLKAAGFPASIEKLERPGGKTLYVVSITPLASLDEAERVRADVKNKFKVNGVIKMN